MIRNGRSRMAVGVVDGDHRYQASLLPLSARTGTPFRFYDSGSDALRRSRTDQNAIWLIRLDLPDINGFDLFEMLRDRLDGAAVCLVGRAYRQEDELRAYRAGAAMYACPPVEMAWLGHCLGQVEHEAADSPRPIRRHPPGTVPHRPPRKRRAFPLPR